MPLSDIVNVVITRDYLGVSQKGFGTLLIVGEAEAQGTRTAVYSSLQGMLDAGFVVTDKEYIMASTLLKQSPTVTSFKVGEKRSGDASWTVALNAIIQEDNDFYGLAIESHLKADQIEVAGWVESLGGQNRKIFFLSSSESAIVDSTFGADSTSIAYELQQGTPSPRSNLLYSANANSQYPECAMAGVCLREVVGSYTQMFKKLLGVTADTMTDTQEVNALAKNCNIYSTVGGSSIVREGRTSDGAQKSGEYLDTIIGIDWTHARITESILAYLLSQKKVPFTDSGITGIQSKIEEVLSRGIANGLFSPKSFDEDGVQTGGYVVNVPLAANVSTADKAARKLTGVTFTAWLAGAIHAVTINGVVTL